MHVAHNKTGSSPAEFCPFPPASLGRGLTGEKTELPATIDDDIKALEMAVAAYRSARTGQLVTFPLTEEDI